MKPDGQARVWRSQGVPGEEVEGLRGQEGWRGIVHLILVQIAHKDEARRAGSKVEATDLLSPHGGRPCDVEKVLQLVRETVMVEILVGIS